MAKSNPQVNVFDAAHRALMTVDPDEKCRLTWQLAADVACGRLTLEGASTEVTPVLRPGRPDRVKLVHPRDLEQRKLHTEAGRATLIHAIAHIEFNAINLALDVVYRFREMPETYYSDWIRVASEEASHFQWISKRLNTLGYTYGDFSAHNGLWDMAVRSASTVLMRMALVPRVFEARGLDVTPGMINKLRSQQDRESADILQKIYLEEHNHVAVGDAWFRWACEQQGLPAEEVFLELVQTHLPGQMRAKLNREARRKVGFSDQEMDNFEEIGIRR